MLLKARIFKLEKRLNELQKIYMFNEPSVCQRGALLAAIVANGMIRSGGTI